jgi:hypothetical protein
MLPLNGYTEQALFVEYKIKTLALYFCIRPSFDKFLKSIDTYISIVYEASIGLLFTTNVATVRNF